MSKCAHGKFLQLDQNATDYSIESPYDDEINSTLNLLMSLSYSTESKRKETLTKL